jgi:hypothetical protein
MADELIMHNQQEHFSTVAEPFPIAAIDEIKCAALSTEFSDFIAICSGIAPSANLARKETQPETTYHPRSNQQQAVDLLSSLLRIPQCYSSGTVEKFVDLLIDAAVERMSQRDS